MARLTISILCLVVTLIAQSSGHFLLNYPPTIGFDDDLEATAPCGSFTVNFATDNVTDFHVDGDSLAMTSIHPQATWLFRATLDQSASGNWSVLSRAVKQTGLGDYCETNVTVPTSFAGSKGVIQVVQDAPDGILYQCAAVKFVSGIGSPPSICKNVTGLTANFTSDPALSSLPASASATSSATASSSSTSIPSLATTINAHEVLDSVMWLVMIACGTLMARLLI